MNDRVAEHRERMADNGYQQLAVLLERSTIQRLDKLCKSTGQSRRDTLTLLIKAASK